MIEKRAPRVSSLPDDDDMANATTELHDDDDGLDPLHEGEDEHEFDRSLDDPEIDPVADAARRKRNGNLIFYGGIVVVLTIVGFLALPTFKRALGLTSGPVQTAGPVIAVPQGAHENHFKLTDKGNNPAPTAPAGGFVAPPVGQPQAPTPSAQPQTAVNTGPGVLPALPTPPDSVALQPASPIGSVPSTAGGRPVAVAPPTPVVAALPAEPLAKQADLTALSGKVDGMAATLTSLAADKDANAAQLKQIQASLDSLQHQIGDLAAIKAAQPAAAPKPVAVKTARATVHKEHMTRSIPGFSLRSATPGMALLAQNGSSDLQKVSVGDTVPKLGRILSISEYNGRWVVRGTGGSVTQ